MSTGEQSSQYELGRNSITIQKHLNKIDDINKNMGSVKSLTSTQSKKFRGLLTRDKKKLIIEIEKIHLKHKNNFIKKMKDKSSDVMSAKLRILRSDKSKAEKDRAILQLNMMFDMFLLKTVQEAQEHPFVKLHPEFIREINDVRMKLSPKSPLKRTATSRRPATRGTRGESAKGKGSLKNKNKKVQKRSKKNKKTKNSGKKSKLAMIN